MDVLRTFVTVAQLQGITRAGEQLGRSQPAISLQIKRLETQLDTKLFLRDGHVLSLNDAGTRLFDYAQRILLLNDEAVSHFTAPLIGGTVRLGIPSEFATTLLPKVVGRFAKVYPEVALEVTSNLSANLMVGYTKGHFDLVLALHDKGRKKQPGKVKDDDLVWVSQTSDVTSLLSNDAPVPLIVAPNGCIYRKRALQALKAAGQAWHIVYTNPDLTGIKAAIEEGMGVTALARSTVPESLHILKPTAALPALGKITISLLHRHNDGNEAANRLLQDIHASLS